MNAASPPPFALGDSGHAADILEGARCVTRFLTEVCPCMTEEAGRPGLSESGTFGLQLVLEALNKTIEAAASAL